MSDDHVGDGVKAMALSEMVKTPGASAAAAAAVNFAVMTHVSDGCVHGDHIRDELIESVTTILVMTMLVMTISVMIISVMTISAMTISVMSLLAMRVRRMCPWWD